MSFWRTEAAKDVAREALGFASSAPLILVIGGSQGSVGLNNCILENLPALLEEAQILHQTGAANFPEVEKISKAALRRHRSKTAIRRCRISRIL